MGWFLSHMAALFCRFGRLQNLYVDNPLSIAGWSVGPKLSFRWLVILIGHLLINDLAAWYLMLCTE